MNKCIPEVYMSWAKMIHPDLQALEKRDTFLSDKDDVQNIEFIDGEIHADINMEN